MTKKSKALLALGVLSLALLIGSGAARCSMAGDPAQDDPTTSEQAAPQTESAAVEADSNPSASAEGPGEGDSPEEDGFSSLANTSWTLAGGTATLSIIDGAMIEREGDVASVFYFTLEEEVRTDDGLNATLNVSDRAGGTTALHAILVEQDAKGATMLVCDFLKGPYMKDAPKEASLSLINANEDLHSCFGKTEANFQEVLEAFIAGHSPYATKASWDKEVWIDYASGTYLTTFTLDDPTATIVTVMMDSQGRLSAS